MVYYKTSNETAIENNSPKETDDVMKVLCCIDCDAYTMASLWYSLFRTDQRPAISKINVPFLYIMPETPTIFNGCSKFLQR